jgi:hypothetical protein
MNKKGSTAMVATVLLIGFTIVLAIIIMRWSLVIEPEPEEIEEERVDINIAPFDEGVPLKESPLITIDCDYIYGWNWSNKNMSLVYRDESEEVDMIEICKRLKEEK